MFSEGAAALDRMIAWRLTVNEPEAWDDFVRWVWHRCAAGDGDDLGLPAPPDIDAALLALCNHMAGAYADGKAVIPDHDRCLTCALAELAHHCPDCGDPAFACDEEQHVVVPLDVPTGRPVCEADNFPVVGVGCYGTITAPVRTIGRDR